MNLNGPLSKIISVLSGMCATLLLAACASSQGQPLVVTSSSRYATATRPPWCKPLPTEPPILGTATATPNILTPYVKPSTPLLSSVPIPTPHIVDLAPDLPFDDKLEVLVFRCNGQEDLVLVDPKDDPYKVVPLAEGDIILVVAPPASLMEHQLPTQKPSPIYPTNTPNANPYPFGTPFPLPYPIGTPSPSPYP